MAERMARGPHCCRRATRSCLVASLSAALALGAGCAEQGAAPSAADGGTSRATLVSFSGYANPLTGEFRIDLPPQPTQATEGVGSRVAALSEVKVVQDGRRGEGPPDTVELVTTRTGSDVEGCGRADAFCGEVELRSFYSTIELRGLHVELVVMSPPTGNSAFGDSPAGYDLSDAYGLWSYGNLAPLGVAKRTWKFDSFTGTAFFFRGRVVASLEPRTTPREDLCNDRSDNDGDGIADCADPDCAVAASCAAEACGNDFDDDGDGAADCADSDCAQDVACPVPDPSACAPDGLERGCYSGPDGSAGAGLCHAGTQVCAAGRWGVCSGAVVPAAETCDQKDNDCDGQTDEENVCAGVWVAMPSGTTSDLTDIWGSSDNDVFAVGANGTIVHFDGSSWALQGSGTTAQLNGVWGSAHNSVYAVGFGHPAYAPKATVLRYNGSSWALVTTVDHLNLMGISGASATDIWAVGDGSALHYNGSLWTKTLVEAGANGLNDVWVHDASNVWIAGAQGRIYRFDGSRWTAQLSNISSAENVWGLWGTSPSNVYAAWGNISHFDGSTWSSTGQPSLFAVAGSAHDDVYAVGDPGQVRHWRGVSWATESTRTTQGLRGVWIAPSGTAYAVGKAGTILRRLSDVRPVADTTPPAIGSAIASSSITGTGMTVSWGAASDDVTAAASLQYKLVKSSSAAAIDTVGEVDAIAGADRVMDWTTATATKTVTGLAYGTTYWFAVLVRDEAGNMALYPPRQASTLIYTNWNPGSPDNSTRDEWCAFLSRNWYGTWDDRTCSVYGRCVCRRSNGSLFLTGASGSWAQCPGLCTSAGGTFSMPKSPEENVLVYALSTDEYNLISYYDPTHSASQSTTRPFVEWVP